MSRFTTMVLFNQVVQIFTLTDLNRRFLLRVVALDRSSVGPTLIDRDLLGHALTPDRLAQKAQGGRAVAVRGEQEIHRLARFVVNLSDEVALAARLQNRA